MPKLKPAAKWADLQCCTRSGYALVMQGLHTIVRVAQSDNLKLSLEAGRFLVEYGEGVMREKAAQQAKLGKPLVETASREAVIAELRGLYAQALGAAPLIVEAQAESEPVAEQPPAGKRS